MMIKPTEREIYLSKKCMGWYNYKTKDGNPVLRDDAPEEIRKADQEIRELRKKNNPAGWVW